MKIFEIIIFYKQESADIKRMKKGVNEKVNIK